MTFFDNDLFVGDSIKGLVFYPETPYKPAEKHIQTYEYKRQTPKGKKYRASALYGKYFPENTEGQPHYTERQQDNVRGGEQADFLRYSSPKNVFSLGEIGIKKAEIFGIFHIEDTSAEINTKRHLTCRFESDIEMSLKNYRYLRVILKGVFRYAALKCNKLYTCFLSSL